MPSFGLHRHVHGTYAYMQAKTHTYILCNFFKSNQKERHFLAITQETELFMLLLYAPGVSSVYQAPCEDLLSHSHLI